MKRTILVVAAAGLAAAAMLAAAATTSAESSGAGQERIVGGDRAEISDHPYAVYLADRQGDQYCGGTLVASDRVVTAAHCIAETEPERITVVAGRQDTRSDDGVETGVRAMWIPEEYSNVGEGNDIAVLQLARKMPYRTLALAGRNDGDLYTPGRKATVLGWGQTAESGERSPVLRSARVPLRKDSACERAYDEGYQPDDMVCAGYPDGGVDACQGDSGGPLVSGGKLIGIVSWGEGCARPGKPGVYTEVRAFAAQVRSANPKSGGSDSSQGFLPVLGG